MSSEPAKAGNSKRPRRPISGWEILSLLLFGFGTLMMLADYLATEARPLTHLPGIAPWYISYLPWLGVAFVLVCWLAFRRGLGAWVPFLAYMVFLLASIKWLGYVANQRIETIQLVRPLELAEAEQLETAVGERVYPRSVTGRPPQLLIRRDPQVHERAAQWLNERMGLKR